jgi:hypothetical protein
MIPVVNPIIVPMASSKELGIEEPNPYANIPVGKAESLDEPDRFQKIREIAFYYATVRFHKELEDLVDYIGRDTKMICERCGEEVFFLYGRVINGKKKLICWECLEELKEMIAQKQMMEDGTYITVAEP